MRIRIWPRVQSITRAITALRSAATSEHDMARREVGVKSKDLRAEAEEDTAAAKDLWTELHEREPMKMRDASDDSVHGNSAPVQITRFHLPKDAREILIGSLLALSIAVNIWCAMTIRDAGTEQRLQQYNLDWFKTHEFSDLKGEVAVQGKLLQLECRK